MNVNFESLLHSRVLTHCKQLYIDGHYKYAALEAMTQVELALKEKSGTDKKFGTNLAISLFGDGSGKKLRVPFGDEMQTQAETLFKGAFVYYRNYCAHDGVKVDGQTCLRVLVLASELLDLVGASQLSFSDIGGIEGLIKTKTFPTKDSILDLLHLLNDFTLPDDDAEPLDDDLLERGLTRMHVDALIDIGLVEYVSQKYDVPFELFPDQYTAPDTIGWFQLTELGNQIAGKA